MAITRDEVIRLLEANVMEYVEAAEDDDPGYWDRFATDQQVINDYAMYVYFGQDDISGHVATPLVLARDWVKLAIREGATFETGKAAVYAFLKCISWGEARKFLEDVTHDAWHEGKDVGLGSTVHHMLYDEDIFDHWMSLWMKCRDKNLLDTTSMMNEGYMGRSLQDEAHIEVENFAHMCLKKTLLMIELNGAGRDSLPEREIELAKDLGLINRETGEVLCLND